VPEIDPAVRLHDEQAQLFSQRYERRAGRPFADAFAYTRRKIEAELNAELARLAPGALVLDIGCGTGHQVRWARELGFRSGGCDPAIEMLHEATAAGAERVYAQSRGEGLPYRDGVADAVISIEVTRYLADPAPALAEMYRVLKPGGVAMITFAPRPGSNLYPQLNHLTRRVRVPGFAGVPQYFYREREVQELLSSAGFIDVDVRARFFGPFVWLDRIRPGWSERLLRPWERYDDRLAGRPNATDFANVFIAVAQRS
jgi:ubiquinone/menaquinone biosynthesis C-methylase UbiE